VKRKNYKRKNKDLKMKLSTLVKEYNKIRYISAVKQKNKWEFFIKINKNLIYRDEQKFEIDIKPKRLTFNLKTGFQILDFGNLLLAIKE
jgi:hypothetical protein